MIRQRQVMPWHKKKKTLLRVMWYGMVCRFSTVIAKNDRADSKKKGLSIQ